MPGGTARGDEGSEIKVKESDVESGFTTARAARMSDLSKAMMQAHWDERAKREAERESANPRKQIHTDLLWREIKRCVGGRTNLRILEAGAGAGRFSLPLAASGHKVTHLDISPQMLEVSA